ncbi:proline-rich proteoglycan 2-like [Falco peregrinus]|uniref:proline-rich proteoglycan 2-like n=1 Tax=Falco peregrinus TaxID=8954 RepID=UPI0024784B78|nr:proline-rich proteoglycan 2-like [Falco peregrinus]
MGDRCQALSGNLHLHAGHPQCHRGSPPGKGAARPVAADTSRPERSASAAGAARIQAAAEGQRRGARCTRTERGSCCGRFPAPALRNEPRRPWRHRPSPPPASARSVPNTALRSPAAPAGGTRPPASPGGGSRCGKRPAAHPGRAGDPLLPPRQGRARARRAQPERPDGGEPRSVARAPMRVGESQRRGHGAPGRELHAAAPHRETRQRGSQPCSVRGWHTAATARGPSTEPQRQSGQDPADAGTKRERPLSEPRTEPQLPPLRLKYQGPPPPPHHWLLPGRNVRRVRE